MVRGTWRGPGPFARQAARQGAQCQVLRGGTAITVMDFSVSFRSSFANAFLETKLRWPFTTCDAKAKLEEVTLSGPREAEPILSSRAGALPASPLIFTAETPCLCQGGSIKSR